MRTTLAQHLVTLIQKWAANLGISDYKYDFTLHPDKVMGSDYARVDTNDVTRDVIIEFNRHKLTQEPDEIESTVVHELLHVRVNEYAEFILDVIRTYVNDPKTKKLLQKQAEKLEHKTIVSITDALLKEKK